ncbi:MAG: preprotein translocase subunit SecG [Rhodospirillales bacterium]|nr:preprotein translocase subunit SecG [Rhodospirillales bacterium]
MGTVLLVIHMILALAIIGLVLIQRSEGGGLGIGGGGGGLGNFATPRSTANALTRATALCVAGFFATSLILGIVAGTQTRSKGILETYGVETKAPLAPVSGDESSAASAAPVTTAPAPAQGTGSDALKAQSGDATPEKTTEREKASAQPDEKKAPENPKSPAPPSSK